MRRHALVAIGFVALALGLGACGDEKGSNSEGGTAANQGLPQGSEPVELDPADFTTEITNPYWPMKPGNRWVYREVDSADGGPGQKVVVEVTDRTKTIANGIEARVVHDIVSEDGVPVEVTDDWYAQDADGNVWYLGEDTQEYVDGKPGPKSGSFEAGVDGAYPGVIMPANPEPQISYRQEYYEGEAEDEAQILSGDQQVLVPFGHFTDVLTTRDLVPLEPKVEELKFYARDVGPVLTIKISGGSGTERLVSFTEGS